MKSLLFLKQEKQFVVAFFALIIILIGMFYMYNIVAPSNFTKDKLVILAKGSTLQEISEQLANENIISSPKFFSRIVMALEGELTIQAGSYYFHTPQNAFDVARRLVNGERDLKPLKVTIPEGLTRVQIAQIFEKHFKSFDLEEFLLLTADKEGYIFPDTYFFFPDSTTKDVLFSLEQNFKNKTFELQEIISASDKSLQDIIIMASIIEAEAYNVEDMRKIAGVLWKRLEIGMPLQVDVTFRYINGKGTFDLTLDDLKLDSPYNTYVNKGLPPTPISNPGLDAIKAAIEYTESDNLFFLADDTGKIHYSKTFAEHKRKKILYLQ